jgi:hypothetical protein
MDFARADPATLRLRFSFECGADVSSSSLAEREILPVSRQIRLKSTLRMSRRDPALLFVGLDSIAQRVAVDSQENRRLGHVTMVSIKRFEDEALLEFRHSILEPNTPIDQFFHKRFQLCFQHKVHLP